MVPGRFTTWAVLAMALLGSGCGYTNKTNLPENIRTVHVSEVQNAVNVAAPITTKHGYQAYRPGLEVDLRNAVIDRVVFDGHLKIAAKDRSDAVLALRLLDYKRDPLRYRSDDVVQEFRVEVTAAVQFVERQTGKVLWEAGAISGNASYLTGGRLARSEDEAVGEALTDLSRHILENILEVW